MTTAQATPCLVFDVGGTNLRAGLFDPASQQLQDRISRPTPSHWLQPDATGAALGQDLFATIADMARQLLPKTAPTTVGMAFPGPIDEAGRVLQTPTVWGDRQAQPLPLLDHCQRLWPTAAVSILNDVTAAGYRYAQQYDGDFCIVTVSSGIGCKLFIDGRPIVGRHGRGGEIGHLRVQTPTRADCDCGGQGHLGAIASGRGVWNAVRARAHADSTGFARSQLAELVANRPEHIDNPHIVQAFRAADPWTAAIVTECSEKLANVLAGIHTAVGTERYIIVGGFALALGEPYRRLLAKLARDCCWDLGQDWEQMLTLGRADDDHCLIGAGICALAQRP